MDTQQQQAANLMAGGLGIGIMLFVVLISFAFVAFATYVHWRIFVKAGMAGPLALLYLVPLGFIIVPCILAFGEWQVVPAVPQQSGLPPAYPPPPPPPSFPSSGYSS